MFEGSAEYQQMFLTATIENMDVAVVACNEKGELVLFNRAARDWHGLDALKIPQAEWGRHYDLFMEDGKTPMDINTLPLSRAFRGQQVSDAVMVIAAKSQPKRYVHVYATTIKAKDGRILGAITVMHDITRRKQLEEELRESEARFSTIFRVNPVGVAISRMADNTFVDVNSAFCDIFGYTPQEILGRSSGELGLLPDFQERQKIVLKLRRHGLVRQFECKFARKSNATGEAVISVGVVLLGGQEHLMIVAMDITDARKSELKLREAAREWERTFDAIGDLIFIMDKDMHIIKINKAGVELLKMDPQHIIGRKCHEIVHHLGHSWPGCPFEETKLDFQAHTHEVDDPRLGRYLLVTVSPIFDEDKNFIGAVHIARDITQIRKSQQEQQEHLREMEIFYKGSIGREERILELKEEIIRLKTKLSAGEQK